MSNQMVCIVVSSRIAFTLHNSMLEEGISCHKG